MTSSALPAVDVLAPVDHTDDFDVAARTVGLTKRYGSLFAVRNLDLVVPRGAVFGLIGPNGAGKSTTFAVLATLLRPTSGHALVLGRDPVRDPRAVRKSVGYAPDQLGVYDMLRVDEYLQFFASAYHIPKSRWSSLVDDLLELVELQVKRTSMVDSLSRGMKQRLSLARALVHDPELLILDEPASGLDPRARMELRDLIGNLRAMGKTVIVSSHILPELQEICTHIAIMEAGELLASGEPATIGERLGHGRRVLVRLADGTEQSHVVADKAEQGALLRRLVVDEGLDVVEFREESGSLEQLFLHVTKGTVQ
jgi:ABC-2 type transport system ATP-binding protein